MFFVKKIVHSKRNSNSFFWISFFKIRDFNHKAVINRLLYKYNRQRWLRHTNITNKYKNQLYRGFEKILETRSIKCNPRSKVELHVVSGHFHLTMYLLAVKSLLRFYNDISVVVHDGDDSFTKTDIYLLKKHIKGIKIIKRSVADKKMKLMLKDFPRIKRYRSMVVNSFELIDNLAFAKTRRIITMNSDVLFLKKPTELINWIKQSAPEIAYVYERKPAMQKEFLKEMNCDFSPHFTLALACVPKDILNFEIIEKTLARSKMVKSHPWLLGQCIYPMLLNARSWIHKSKTFNKSDYEASGVFKKNPVFRHYWSSLGTFLSLHITDAEKVIDELK